MTSVSKASILKKVFSTNPAESSDFYVKSHAFDQRYVLTTRGKLTRQSVSVNGQAKKWLKELNTLGDYEKGFVSDILNAPGRIVAYRSGTGSGKSSLVRTINNAMDQFSHKNSWKSALHCRSFTAVIDLQAADSADIGISARLDDETNSDDRIAEHDKLLFKLLLDKTNDALWSQCDDSDMKRILKELAKNEVFSRSAPYRKLLREVRSELDGEPGLLVQRFEDYLGTLTEKQAFDLILHVFLFIGHKHHTDRKRGTHRKSFILFVDNSDKLHHVILTRLLNHLKEFNANTEGFESGLKIALFLRLSTSKDQIGAIAEADYRYYSSPEPKDLVLNRALNFILSDDEAYSDFENFDVLLAKFSVLELLIELLDDGIRDFADSLDAVSGTNIRNAFTHVIAWCSSDELRHRTGTADEFRQEVKKFIRPFLASEMRSITRKFTNYLGLSLGSLLELPPGKSARRISTNLNRIFQSYLSDSDLSNEGINTRIRRFLVESVAEDPVLISEFASIALDENQTEELSFLMANAIAKIGAGGKEQLISIVKGCLGTLSSPVGQTGIDGIEQTRNEVVRTYLNSILKTLEPSSQQIGESRVAGFRLPVRGGRQSRFERTMLLYDVESDDEESSLTPVNLISIDDFNIRSCKLRILYDLCEQQESQHSAANGVKYDKIRSRLIAFGYKKKEIRESMRALTDLSTRLIYSRVADHHYYSSPDWERKFLGKNFFISWAGYKYYTSMLSNPTYIQWMLTNTSEVQASFTYDQRRIEGVRQVQNIPRSTEVQPRFLENMQNACDGLNRLRVYEERKFNRFSKESISVVSHLCRSPIVDLIFRSSLPLLRTIKYVEDVAERSQHDNFRELKEFSELKANFVELLLNSRNLCKYHFETYPNRWDKIYEQAERLSEA